MNYFLVINGKKLKRYLIIAVAAVFTLGIVYAEKENVTVFSQSEPGAIYSVKTENKSIALTFDISWGEERAEPILEILEDKGVENVTFFLSAPWSKDHPDVVQKIVDSGYEIGNHGHKHVNYSSLDDADIRKQIRVSHQTLSEATGKSPGLIRLPNGDFDKRVLRIADELNYKVIQWDTDSLDWMNIGVDKIVNRVVTKAHPGDIVLMHASDSCKQTHLALPIIIDKLRADGYEFVTVSGLLAQAEMDQSEVRDHQPKSKK